MVCQTDNVLADGAAPEGGDGAVQRKTPKAGLMLLSDSAAKPGQWGAPALQVFATEASTSLGASRCAQLSAASRASADGVRKGKLLRMPFLGQGLRSLDESDARRLACSKLLQACGAPTFNIQSVAVAEDAAYVLLAEKELGKWVPDMLASHSSITGFGDVRDMVAALGPKCKLPAAAVSRLFGPQVERSKMLFLSPRPLHYAVVHSSARLAGMLLAAAGSAGSLGEALGRAPSGAAPATLSPLFLAVLFADQDVVEMLTKHGAALLNDLDVTAAMRLQSGGLWEPFKDRMGALQLSGAAAELGDRVQEARRKITENRAALKALLQ